jgi:uncharacterized protein involved in exopolysaccharide biosynthesis
MPKERKQALRQDVVSALTQDMRRGMAEVRVEIGKVREIANRVVSERRVLELTGGFVLGLMLGVALMRSRRQRA